MPRYSKPADQIGAKVGPRLAELISQTIVHTKRKLLDTEHRARVHSMQEIIDRAGHEVADLYRPVLQEVLAESDMPDSVREMIEKSLSGHHQWQALSGAILYGAGASSSLTTILSNFLAPGVRKAVQSYPQLSPPPETMALLAARGMWDPDNARGWAAGDGYDHLFTDALMEAARSYPDNATTVEMLRRGLITTTQANLNLTRNGVPSSLHGAALALQRQILSPADLADMVVRGIKTEADAAHVAAQSGVTEGDFNALVLDTGEPLALMQLLEAYRRGFINRERLEHGIKQSRIRDEWIPVAEQLRYSPMSVADAVAAVVQNHLTMSQGESISQQNGLLPGQFGTLYETAGEPLSRTEMEQLYNRGLVTEADVLQALRESRLKNKYLTQAFALHTKLLEPRMVAEAVEFGAATHQQATRIATEYGHTAEDAKILVSMGSLRKIQGFKSRVVAAVEQLYTDNAITEPQARHIISGLGFSDTEITFILQAANFHRDAHQVSSVLSAVRSKYVGHHITARQAEGYITTMGVPAERRDYLMKLWDLERAANVRVLTPAQILAGHKKKLISDTDALARLENLGYSKGDAELLLAGA